MVRLRFLHASLCLAAVLACGVARGDDSPGQEKLDKATATKLSAENTRDLNEVITLCQEAIKEGLDETGTAFAKELLASTLTQRAELICSELFERPVTPNRGRKLVQMALSDLQETIELDPNQSLAQYLLGRLYSHLGEKEKGLKALDEAVRLSADDAPARAKALMIRANLKTDPAERQADFDEAVKLTPHEPDVLRFRGMYFLTQNKGEAALEDFKAALAIEPDDPDTHEACGIALMLLEKYDEAMESFNKALELAPENVAALTQRARVRAIKGDTPAALRDVERALELQAGSVQALQLHAALLGSTGKFDRALADLNLLRQAMPDNPDLLLQIGALYQASKKSQKAIATYDMVLVTDPANAAAYRGRADAQLSLGKQADAIADYEKAIQQEPKNSGALNNLAWLLATSPEDELRNGKRAIELATLACEVTEYKQAHILSTLAAGYAETGDFDTAKTWSKKAVEQSAENVKGQLQKELDSYEAKKPWRETVPPTEELEQPQAPGDEDTARRTQRGS